VLIQGKNAWCLFREEMTNVYSGKKLIVFIQGRNEYCLFMEEKNSAYSGKNCIKIVLIQGRYE
jgi:hypothetical protein